MDRALVTKMRSQLWLIHSRSDKPLTRLPRLFYRFSEWETLLYNSKCRAALASQENCRAHWRAGSFGVCNLLR